VLAEDETATQAAQAHTEERAGKRVSAATQDKLHGAINHALGSARAMMDACGCDDCAAAASRLDPDNDGDIDILGGLGDTDGDAQEMMKETSDRALEPVIQRLLAPTLSRVNAMLAHIAATPQAAPPAAFDTGAIERRLDAIEKLTVDVAHAADVAEVRSLLSEVKELAVGVKDLAERIATQPTAGGPIPNAAAMDKLLATGGATRGAAAISDTDLVRLARERGILQSQEDMVVGAARQIRESVFGAQR
jgi:hypothetical protein